MEITSAAKAGIATMLITSAAADGSTCGTWESFTLDQLAVAFNFRPC
jgi:hypothetical protein